MAEALFPKQMESILAGLSYVYKLANKNILLEIIVKGKYDFTLFYTSDNWNGGTYTHTISFKIPEDLYARIFNEINDIQTQLCSDINNANHIENESIERVDIEIDLLTSNNDWRRKTGLLSESNISMETQKRIWGVVHNYKIFISHKTENKKYASTLKKNLSAIGISCFVAHEDIEPTSVWISEILSALFSADALIALISENFYDSQWTDQEIGCAIGRDIPIFPFRLGNDPHGFIGRYQAIKSSWDDLHINIVPYLLREPKMKNAVIQATRTFDYYTMGHFLLDTLDKIEHFEEAEIDQLIQNYNESYYLRNCMAMKQGQYLRFINKKSKRHFECDSQGIIKQAEIDF